MVVYALLCLAVIGYLIIKFDKADKRYDAKQETTPQQNVKINNQPIILDNDDYNPYMERGFKLMDKLVKYIVTSADNTVTKMPCWYSSSDNVILGQLIILSYMIILKQCYLYPQCDTEKLQEVFIERIHNAAKTTLVLDSPDKSDKFMKMIINLYMRTPSEKNTVDVTAMAEKFTLYIENGFKYDSFSTNSQVNKAINDWITKDAPQILKLSEKLITKSF